MSAAWLASFSACHSIACECHSNLRVRQLRAKKKSLSQHTAALSIVHKMQGVYRGLQDTRTPLWATLGSNVLNVVLNTSFVVGAGWGVRGAALGTVIAQVSWAHGGGGWGVGVCIVCVHAREGLKQNVSSHSHSKNWAAAAASQLAA